MLIGALLYYAISAYLVWLLLKRQPNVVFSAPALYAMITSGASVFYIEANKSFISETEVYGYDIGATFRHSAYAFLALFTIYFSARFFSKLSPANTTVLGLEIIQPRKYRLLLILFLGLLGLQFINVVLSGLAFSQNRHSLWLNVPVPQLASITGVLVGFFPFFVGYLYSISALKNSAMYKYLSFAMFGVYVIFLLGSGQGFHGLLLGAILFGSPIFFLLYINDRKQLRPMVLLFCVLAIFGFFYTAIEISSRGISQFSAGGTFGTAIYRMLVLQGGVYYTNDLMTFTSDSRASYRLITGDMSELLFEVLPAHLAYQFDEKGINLASSLSGTSIRVAGYFGATIIVFLYAILQGFLISVISRAVVSSNGISIALASYLMLWSNSVYVRGSFASVLDFKFWLFLITVLLLNKYSFRRLKAQK